MELRVKNIGKMDNAKIQIEGLTVITGYNGTGKSSICRALYSIMDTFSNVNQKIFNQKRTSLLNLVTSWETDLLDTGLDEKEAEEVISSILQYVLEQTDLDNILSFEDEIRDLLDEIGIKIKDNVLQRLLQKYSDIVKKGRDEYIEFFISKDIKSNFRNQVGHVNLKKRNSVITLCDEQKVWEIVFRANELVRYDYKYNTLKSPIYIEPKSILDEFDTRYRFAYMQGNESVTRLLMHNELHKDEVTLEEYKEQQNNMLIINEILQEVTNGRLVSRNNVRLSYYERGLNDEIVCGNIASGLKPFLIIQRMIENGTLGQGRVLIIDEPEVNLHPEWQLQFAKILVLLNAKLNIKVVLSTHSPYFLRAIEYYMKEYGNDANGKYYITSKQDNELYTLLDVTGELENIYKTLYRPFEEIN